MLPYYCYSGEAPTRYYKLTPQVERYIAWLRIRTVIVDARRATGRIIYNRWARITWPIRTFPRRLSAYLKALAQYRKDIKDDKGFAELFGRPQWRSYK
jgi:hypothetical protein